MRRDIGIEIQLQCADRERMRTCAEQDAAALACADALNGLCAGFAALAEGTEPVSEFIRRIGFDKAIYRLKFQRLVVQIDDLAERITQRVPQCCCLADFRLDFFIACLGAGK